MLLAFACSNHKSIRDEVVFSTLAEDDALYKNNVETISGTDMVKTSLIYGANASGKSNFLSAISFVKGLVLNSYLFPRDQEIWIPVHKSEGYDTESTYRMHVLHE